MPDTTTRTPRKPKQMTVRTLIRLLIKCNPDALVVLGSDPAGNAYSQVINEPFSAMYRPPEHPWQPGTVLEQDEEGSEPAPGDVACVVLWPSA